jgi:hypothetical protein
MTKTAEMLRTYPGEFGFDADQLARAIDAMVECASTCNQCADACLAEDDVAAQVTCIRRNLDCADACTAAARILGRQTSYEPAMTRAILEACVEACRLCGDECERHGEHGMEHCARCAESCRACEQQCRELLDAMG